MSNVVTIPSSPQDRAQIRERLTEISNSMTRIEAERDHINEILADMQDEYELPKKHMRKVARVFHKQNMRIFTTRYLLDIMAILFVMMEQV
jgi:archaellum component FlaC